MTAILPRRRQPPRSDRGCRLHAGRNCRSSSRNGVAFDLTQQAGRASADARASASCKASLEEIDRNVRDYSCTFVKQERVDGELGEQQHILLKVMHQPFSVYMSFLKPFPAAKCVYVDGQNNDEMVVLEAGFKRMLGKMNLDPNGALAMNGQKHPITAVGIRNLTAKLIKMSKPRRSSPSAK